MSSTENTTTCHCVCQATHPHNALFQRCTATPEPGLYVIRQATAVGKIHMPVCRYCYTHAATQRPQHETS